jgi:hypothetical protein
MSKIIKELKEFHKQIGCAFTVATVFREPVSHAISSFYFNLDPHHADPNISTWDSHLSGKGHRKHGTYMELDNYQTRYTLNNHRDLIEFVKIGSKVGSVNTTHLCIAARVIRDVVDVVGFTDHLSEFWSNVLAGHVSPNSVGTSSAGALREYNKNSYKKEPPTAAVQALAKNLETDIALFWYLRNGTASTATIDGKKLPDACSEIGVKLGT